MSIGKAQKTCYGCSYCRAFDNDISIDYRVIPGELNPLFRDIPVAINLFYGDPVLQEKSTNQILERLDKDKHRGPVIIITKGDLMNDFPAIMFKNLDIHFGLSTFGINSKYDGGTIERFESNINWVNLVNGSCLWHPNYKKSIEFRPIIKGINDSDEVFRYVVETAKKNNMAIGYCGLQVSNSLKEKFKIDNLPFEPYPGHEFGLKKFISAERDKSLRKIAKENGVFVFKKTSCLLAYTHNLSRDPNAHYYRPNEVGCFDCPMKEKCFKFKEENNKKNSLLIEIPFDYELVEKRNHVCGLFAKGICKFPSADCKNISGKMIRIKEPLTTTDVRLIKWLTGYTVDAEFTESPFMSQKWIVNS